MNRAKCHVKVPGESPEGVIVCGLVLIVLVWAVSASPASGATCANEAFRVGASAALPDCRAYELITPTNTNGRLVGAINTFGTPGIRGRFPTELASPSAPSFVYLSYVSPLLEIGDANGISDVYQAVRGEGGWTTSRRLDPPGALATSPIPGGIASDHQYATVNVGSTRSSLALGGNADYLINPDGTYELVGIGSLGEEPFVQTRWITPGGDHVIFSSGKAEAQSLWCAALTICKVQKLEPEAAPTGTGVVYDRAADGNTRVVSLLPGDVPAGSGENAFYKGTSADASSIAFTIASVLYVRVNNGEAGVEETQKVAEGNATFAGLSDDGRYLFYVASGDIHRFDTSTEDDEQLTGTGDAKVVAVSGDGSHAYFVSKEEIGGVGTAGQPNLYVWRAGATDFIATVLSSEAESVPGLAVWTSSVVGSQTGEFGLGASTARTTHDGDVLAFESRAQLTPYDNEGFNEIYRYEEGQGVVCVSCNFGQETEADAHLQDWAVTGFATVINNVSDDGRQIFFETKEDLVSEDVSPANDIYEWQEEPSGATKISLISSGRSIDYPTQSTIEQPFQPKPNVLLSVTPDGHDVAFQSQDILVPGAGEGGMTAIYDARVDGGFPLPGRADVCTEEACWPSAGAISPSPSGAESEAIKSSGNVKKHKPRHRCRQGRKKRKHRRCGGSRQARSSGGQATVAAERSSAEQSAPSERAATGPTSVTSTALAQAANFDEYGFKSVGADLPDPTAGAHSDFQNQFTLNFRIDPKTGDPELDARTEELSIRMPPGFTGNPRAVPSCSMGSFVSGYSCSPDSQVGVASVRTLLLSVLNYVAPVYNLEPPHPDKEVARLGFYAATFPVFIEVGVRTAGDYGLTATVHSANGLDALLRAETTIWGDPADSSHDEQRVTIAEALKCSGTANPGTACEQEPDHKRPSGIKDPKWFFTNPSACQSGAIGFEAKSYQLPGQLFTASAPLPPISDCTGLPFAPTFEAEPTNHTAGAPTGLKTKLVIPQHLGADERATATMREARVTLPEGMQVAAGAANWIDTCSDEQVGFHHEVETACPDASKLGIATFTSPALSVPIEGTIYQRSPSPGHQLGLWLTADALGLHIKLPGELEPDKQTGRLTAVFRGLPQVPVSEIGLNVWGGPRAPLENPDSCGTYTTDFSFVPHSNDLAATGQSQMQINEGCDQAFNPTLKAGVSNPVAGKYSPFVFDLTRPDGDQALRGFSLKLPDGELAKIKGVPLCSDADATAGTCPAASRIGSLTATSGPGPEPFTIPEPGKPQPQIYLAGPYQGAPFSIVSQVPAQAGPFDLGVLAVRNGLEVEPETGRAVVKADPLPQFFEGVGIAYRHLHAVVDRPEFNLNPTDCREAAVTSDVTSTQGTVAHPQARFQVDGCKALKFKPRLSLKLRGGTKRADYPALTAVLKARKGDANIAFTSVALPHSEFLAQEHIGTICTRKQFVADKCPKGSVYGKAKATTPLLDKSLAGPVYLRSSDHPLPDLVVKLGGQLEIHLVGRIDSVNGGIRTTFESVPDAPVTKFVLQMRGGKKGLLTNSTDICRGAHRATAVMRAQNGRAVDLRPKLVAAGCGKQKLGKKKKHR
jgi:hypothetical protein